MSPVSRFVSWPASCAFLAAALVITCNCNAGPSFSLSLRLVLRRVSITVTSEPSDVSHCLGVVELHGVNRDKFLCGPRRAFLEDAQACPKSGLAAQSFISSNRFVLDNLFTIISGGGALNGTWSSTTPATGRAQHYVNTAGQRC